MVESSVIEGTNVVSATYRGSVSAEDVEGLRADLSEVASRGPARLLLQYEGVDVGRVEPAALWEDLKSAGLLQDIERCAVVTDQRPMEAVAAVAKRVAPFEVRHFDADERDEAVAWLTG